MLRTNLKDRGKKDTSSQGSPGGSVVKNPSASEGDAGNMDSIPGSGGFPGENGNPLQYCCLENLMVKGAWRATGHSIAESDHDWSTEHTHILSKGDIYVTETINHQHAHFRKHTTYVLQQRNALFISMVVTESQNINLSQWFSTWSKLAKTTAASDSCTSRSSSFPERITAWNEKCYWESVLCMQSLREQNNDLSDMIYT